MEEEKVYLELVKTGLKLVGDSLVQIISNVNKKRLEEKSNRQKEEKKPQKPVELNVFEKITGSVSIDTQQATENIVKHVAEIERWAHIIKFSDLDKKKTLGAIYIQLDTYLIPAKKHFNVFERSKTITLEKAILSNNEHIVILGQPGAGKTTSLKKICDRIIKEQKTKYTFPILLRLRDLGEVKTTTPILDHISKIIPFEFKFNDTNEAKFSTGPNDAKEQAILAFLNAIKPILVLDGFDELKDFGAKEIVLKELLRMTSKLTDAKLVVSCRTGEFNYELDYSKTFEIAPLNDQQIELFVTRWLKDESKARDFLYKVRASPFADTSIKPLSLAHLCAIYDRIGNIPDQPKTIYRKVVNLLIEEWDEQRSITRESSFTGFQTDKKFEFLTNLAFHLTTVYRSSTFSNSQFVTAYKQICKEYGLPKESAASVVKELESHTGLFIASGYEKFEFVHKSIQEYLAADYLVKLPSLNTVKHHFESLSSELAIAVSISSNSSLYYIELILNYFLRAPLSNSFYSSFTSRIASENPSFSQNELVSVATLVLLSIWINPEQRNLNYNNVLINKEMYASFFDLSKTIKLKEQKVNILQFYQYHTETHDNKFVELIRIKEPVNHKRLPSKIYLPNDFYTEFVS